MHSWIITSLYEINSFDLLASNRKQLVFPPEWDFCSLNISNTWVLFKKFAFRTLWLGTAVLDDVPDIVAIPLRLGEGLPRQSDLGGSNGGHLDVPRRGLWWWALGRRLDGDRRRYKSRVEVVVDCRYPDFLDVSPWQRCQIKWVRSLPSGIRDL